MARRSNIAATAAITLLVVAQVAFAYIVPEMVVMRVKRNPEPMRSFSFSGFNPSGQMAAFTGMAEYPMFSNYGPPSQAGPYHYSPQQAQDSYGLPHTQDSYGPSSQVPQDSYGPAPSGTDQQVAADPNKPKQQSVGQQQQPSQENGLKPSAAESNEENNNSVEQVENKKQYKGRDGPSSNAEASFNAWFPIMFGVFPNGAGGSGNNGQSGNRGNNNNNQGGQGQDQGYSNGGNGFERSSGGTTVIANSVSNGRHGVATSHAIAYGNPRSSSQK